MAICNNCNNVTEVDYPQKKIQEGGLMQYIMDNLEAHKMYTAVISLHNRFKIVQVQDNRKICKIYYNYVYKILKFPSYILCPRSHYK